MGVTSDGKYYLPSLRLLCYAAGYAGLPTSSSPHQGGLYR
jgi:hypothetical protein